MTLFKRILFTAFLFKGIFLFAQQEEIIIPFNKNTANVMETELGINGFGSTFIFDTGASKVSFGMPLYNSLRAKGLLTDNDIVARTSTMMANGAIANALLIRIRHLQLGNSELENIDAMVIEGANVPPLLGQSVLENFGTITIDNRNGQIILRRDVSANTTTTYISELRLVACNNASRFQVQSISQNTFTPGPNVVLVNSIDIEPDLPPQRAVDRLVNRITIRYFSEQDIEKARLLEDKISKKYKRQYISLQDMTPYFNKPIPDYFEIWINL